MRTWSLNGLWTMTGESGDQIQGQIPGSVYSFMLDADLMEDPYYRDNELQALQLMDHDYVFIRTFDADAALLAMEHQVLRFDGIDTLAEVTLNGVLLGKTDNMHIAWEYDVKGLLKAQGNELAVRILSPNKFIREMDDTCHLGGSIEAMKGFSYLRKAHCMFGWDWGPRLPDGGIWKDVTLLGWETSRILDVHIRQRHVYADGSPAFEQERFGEENLLKGRDPEAYLDNAARHVKAARTGQMKVELTVSTVRSGADAVHLTLTDPNGQTVEMEEGKPFIVEQPQLWWPNGLGDQPLYTVKAELIASGPDGNKADHILQTVEKRIGLRTITMRRLKDQWGETFATEVNGQTFFAMGSDYIPEDNILSRCSKERTRKLLADCRESHFNVVRVWGGGYYPSDDFYDLCDEMGLVVWQDMMFACAYYPLTDSFVTSIKEEIAQNIRRLRHHASLGLWCANNEMESFVKDGGYECTDITRADYLIQNEYIIPEIVKAEDPDTFFWPSSPSSGGKLDYPQDPNRGDVHYWDVWHGGVPFSEYRKFCFRYLSEFGFQSFPCLQTVESFTEPEDRNIFSYVMEMHQRNAGANGKIMGYMQQTYRYPETFESVLYASQLLQAEAIRYGVEHFRRYRSDDRCMGAVYWQLNDIWPVASWASIDYFGRWKALQYTAKRFFAPVLLSCEETSLSSEHLTCITEPGERHFSAKLSVSNETWDTVEDTVIWELRNAFSEIVQSGEQSFSVPAFDAVWMNELDFSDCSEQQMRSLHLTYRLKERAQEGSVLFVPAKHYEFADPELALSVDSELHTVTVKSQAFAKAVEVYSDKGTIRFDDNFFDMEKGQRILHIVEIDELVDLNRLKVRSVFDI